jgi:hypothetical protein
LVKRWHKTETAYKDGIKPDGDKDVDLIMKALEAGYVREQMPGGWWSLTPVAREEIDRWGL